MVKPSLPQTPWLVQAGCWKQPKVSSSQQNFGDIFSDGNGTLEIFFKPIQKITRRKKN